MVLIAAILLIALGAMCLFERDMAFRLYEYDALLFGKILRRTREWEALIQTQGVVFILAGILGLIVGFR